MAWRGCVVGQIVGSGRQQDFGETIPVYFEALHRAVLYEVGFGHIRYRSADESTPIFELALLGGGIQV